jgi:hypothetical protein
MQRPERTPCCPCSVRPLSPPTAPSPSQCARSTMRGAAQSICIAETRPSIRPLAICTARPFPQRRLPLARSPADPVGRPNPVLSLLCTTLASAAISTFTVSVCPLSEARCSAVHLQCKCTPPRDGNAEPSPPPATFFERRTHKQYAQAPHSTRRRLWRARPRRPPPAPSSSPCAPLSPPSAAQSTCTASIRPCLHTRC